MRTATRFLSFIIALLFITMNLTGCGNTATEKKTIDKSTDQPANSVTEKKTTEATKPADTAKTDVKSDSEEKIGVSECDEYIQKVEICLKR